MFSEEKILGKRERRYLEGGLREPKVLVHEWDNSGGRRPQMKQFQTTLPEDGIIMYHMYNCMWEEGGIFKANILLETLWEKERTKLL